MDDEMTPYRNAVRAYLRKGGTAPLMWEEITPQDKNARHAYLDGVDQASIFVLLLGRHYGIAELRELPRRIRKRCAQLSATFRACCSP